MSNEGTIAVLALGRKESGEALNSEDTALLATVAGQMATALENARLYRQLHVKALELDRLRAFNENILESLDDGLLVVARRSNRAVESGARTPVRRSARRGSGADARSGIRSVSGRGDQSRATR